MQYVTESEKQAAIDSYCTHLCAQRMSLKINPSHCDRRREMAGKATSALEVYPGWECLECQGPIPRNQSPQQEEPTNMKSEAAEKVSKPGKLFVPKCKCGETDPSRYYIANPYKCKACQAEYQKQRSHPGNIHLPPDPQDLQQAFKEMDDMPDIPEKVMGAVSQPPKSHICKVCGHEFEAYQHGVVKMTRMCRVCITSKVSEATRNRPVKIPSHVPNIILYFEDGDQDILARVSDEAKRNRRTLANQVLFMIEGALNA